MISSRIHEAYTDALHGTFYAEAPARIGTQNAAATATRPSGDSAYSMDRGCCETWLSLLTAAEYLNKSWPVSELLRLPRDLLQTGFAGKGRCSAILTRLGTEYLKQ